MMGIDTPETCRGCRNILRIGRALSWFSFTNTDFHKVLNITCHGNPSNGSCADIHVDGRTDAQMDVTKLIGAFYDNAKAPVRTNLRT